MKFAAVIGVLVGLALLIFAACSTPKPPPSVPPPSGIKAHWIEKGEPSPIDGIVLSEGAYISLRTRIEDLKKLLKECQERCGK